MSRLTKAVVLGIVTGITGVLLSLIPLAGDLEENLGLHILFKLRGAQKAPSDIVVISMDRTSADALNLPEDPRKWPRTLHAHLTEMLSGKGASVIAYDIIFEDNHLPAEDLAFAKALRETDNVVLCRLLKSDRIIVADRKKENTGELTVYRFVNPTPVIAKAAAVQAPFPLPKVPVKLSSYWAFKKDAGDIPTLPVAAFQMYSMPIYDEFLNLLSKADPRYEGMFPTESREIIAQKGVDRFIQDLRRLFEKDPSLGEKMIAGIEKPGSLPMDPRKKRILLALVRLYQGTSNPYLNFYGPPGSIRTISYYQALKAVPSDIRGKAVFIGLSELFRPEQKDGFYTVFTGTNGVDLSGVEIAATAFGNILEDKPVRPLPLNGQVAILFAWGLIMGVICFRASAFSAAAGITGLGIAFAWFAVYQFRTAGIWYPLVIPLFIQTSAPYFAAILWKYVESNRERQSIRKAFEFYLPDDVVNRLVKNLGRIQEGGQTVYGICLYTDAKQYTTMAEEMNPEELGAFMNRYYAILFASVRKYGGVVSNVIGDSMLALWVTSQRKSSIESNACHAALDISKAIHFFNQSTTVSLPTRICLHSGRLFMGNIGAIDHFEYRPIGDIVNTTTRIDSLNKYLGARILVSEDVIKNLRMFQTRKLGTFVLAGKSKAVIIHELIGEMAEADERKIWAGEKFSDGLEFFRLKEWDGAAEKFREYLKSEQDDEPSEFYIEICEQYKSNPPQESWNGEVYIEKQ
jgi:adenylate cyclase